MARRNAFFAGSGHCVLDSVKKLTSNLDLGSRLASLNGMYVGVTFVEAPANVTCNGAMADSGVKAEAVGASGSSKAASSPTITVIDLPRFMEKP